MKLFRHNPIFLACLAAVVSVFTVVTPPAAQAYWIYLEASALTNSDFNTGGAPKDIADETDGSTSLEVAVGPVTGERYYTGGSPNVAQSAASASLVTGELKGFVSATMNSNSGYYLPARAGSYALLRDMVTFDLPEGQSTSDVTLSLTVDGTFTDNADDLVGPFGCTCTDGSDVSGSLYLGGTSASTDSIHPCGLLAAAESTLAVSLPYDLSVTRTVTDGETLMLQAVFALYVANNLQGQTVDFDFQSTAGLDFDLEPGVTFTSESGVLLTIPEPSSLLLLGMGAVGLLAYARRKRRGR